MAIIIISQKIIRMAKKSMEIIPAAGESSLLGEAGDPLNIIRPNIMIKMNAMYATMPIIYAAKAIN